MKVKIIIALKSFEPKLLPRVDNSELQQIRGVSNSQRTLLSKGSKYKKSNITSIALPKTRSSYTVLRSPHIDKKSRDQFEFTIHKQLILINTEIKYIPEKLFNLKFNEKPGIQLKITCQTKTRLSLKTI